MQYLKPFLYFARKPKTGFNNLLLGCLCPLIPIVGEIVLLGYRAQVSEELERDPEMKDHPDIKLDDLMVYLKRGLWPFLTRVMFIVIAIPVVLPAAILTGYIAYEFSDMRLVGLGVGYLIAFALFLLASTLLWPMEYHAQVTQKFSPLAELKFAIGFARVCWLSTFFAVLACTLLGSMVMMIGMLLCYIGMYPAGVIDNMAEQHVMTQLYLLYLEEGGEPIPRPDDEYDLQPRRATILSEDD